MCHGHILPSFRLASGAPIDTFSRSVPDSVRCRVSRWS
jgi:hypothetical protein